MCASGLAAATCPLEEAIDGAEVIVSAISMKGVPELVQRLQGLHIPETTILVTATKGLDPKTTLTPSQIFPSRLPEPCGNRAIRTQSLQRN
jgi:glycerol-3-phosphate dehydrogenase (NAD(P)+)